MEKSLSIFATACRSDTNVVTLYVYKISCESHESMKVLHGFHIRSNVRTDESAFDMFKAVPEANVWTLAQRCERARAIVIVR